MKKKKSSIIAGKFLVSDTFKKLVYDYRVKLGIPRNGFEDDTKTETVWLNTVLSHKIKDVNDFVRDVKEKFPFVKSTFETSAFDYLLFRYLMRNKEEVFNSLNVSGCKLALLWGKNKEKMKEELEDGVYKNWPVHYSI